MHYYALAIVPAEGDVDSLVAETMDPYDENEHQTEKETYEDDDETEVYYTNPVGMWDFWSIGGRWSGTLDGYEPENDPRNKAICWLCHGTGKRNDEAGQRWRAENPSYGCNGCGGTGIETKWPTQWARHDGDVMPASEFAELLANADEATQKRILPYTIFTHDSESVTKQEHWTGETWVTDHDAQDMRAILIRILKARAEAGHVDRVVVVDYHS